MPPKKTNKNKPKSMQVGESYIPAPNQAEQKATAFQCKWSTFWTALGVITGIIIGLITAFNFILSIRLDSINKELDRIHQEILTNEKNREEKTNLQLKIIEQKIEIIQTKYS